MPTELSALEFRLLFIDREGPVQIENIHVQEPLDISEVDARITEIEISFCEFVSISFSDISFQSSLDFSQCKFLNTFKFFKVTLSNTLSFHNCVAGSIDVINDDIPKESPETTWLGDIHIIDSELSSGISCLGYQFANFGIKNSIINGYLFFFSTSCKKYILSDSKIKGPVVLTDGQIGCYSISDCSLDGYVALNNIMFRESVIFRNIICEGSVTLRDPDLTGELVISSSTFKQRFDFGPAYSEPIPMALSRSSRKYGLISNIKISSGTFLEGLYVNGYNSNINGNLIINCSSASNGSMQFDYMDVKKIKLTGVNAHTGISFRYISTSRVEICDFINNGVISFTALTTVPYSDSEIKSFQSKEGSSLFIAESILGKAQVNLCNLDEFDRITINNSTINEITANQVVWFNPSKLSTSINYTNNPTENATPSTREVYRQLKYAMEQQGDRIQALEFKRQEMRQYRMELAQYPVWKLLKERNWELLGNRLVMFLNRSNDYGLNWLKPALLALAFTFLYFLFITISLEPSLSWHPSWHLADWAHTLDILASQQYRFFILLDPTANMSEINNSQQPGQPGTFVYFWVYLQKITLAYLIFQTISAFRKYLK